jgi:hypothetical protein
MNTFPLNGYNVRFFQLEETTYLVTADANKAFGFDGKNTSIDEASIAVADVPKYETFILDTSNGLETLSSRASVIELPNLLGVISRSNKPELKNMQGIMNQLLAKAFAQNFGMQKNQPLLPAISDTDRMVNSAISAKRSIADIKKMKARGEFREWNSPRGMVYKLISDPKKQRAYLNDGKLMRGLRTALAAHLEATRAIKPPQVKGFNCKSKAQGFPPEFDDLAITFLLTKENGGTSSTTQNLLTQSSKTSSDSRSKPRPVESFEVGVESIEIGGDEIAW